MPIMDLTFPAGALDADQQQRVADELTTALLRAERAPDTDFFREITWVFLHELGAGHVLSAGRPVDKPLFRLEVTTPEGALSDRRRAEMVENATRIIRDVAGIGDEDALRVWVLCREIAEGSWGAGGQVIRFQQLREAAAAEREQTGSGAATT